MAVKQRSNGRSAPLLAILVWGLGGMATTALAQGAGCASVEGFEKGWDTEAELGGIYTTGNSDSRTLNGRLTLTYLDCPALHRVTLEGLRASSDGEIWAERYLATLRSEYRYTNHNYLFAHVRYEDDRFSGYDQRITETVGLGRRVLRQEDLTLDIEAGIGGRHSWPSDGERDDEALLRLAGQLVWRLRDGVRFTEDLFVESGVGSNTRIDSRSAVSIELNSRLSLRLSTQLIHNTEVPAGTERTDTISSVNLVFGF